MVGEATRYRAACRGDTHSLELNVENNWRQKILAKLPPDKLGELVSILVNKYPQCVFTEEVMRWCEENNTQLNAARAEFYSGNL